MIDAPLAEVSFTGLTGCFRIILKNLVNPVKLPFKKATDER
jgi:hypothetical protein